MAQQTLFTGEETAERDRSEGKTGDPSGDTQENGSFHNGSPQDGSGQPLAEGTAGTEAESGGDTSTGEKAPSGSSSTEEEPEGIRASKDQVERAMAKLPERIGARDFPEGISYQEDLPVEAIQARLVPEIIVRISGEPVRITVSLWGNVSATMVRKGYFPISTTGYRSVLAGGARVLKRQNGGTVPSIRKTFGLAVATLRNLPEKKENDVQDVVRRCKKAQALDPKRRPIGTIVRANSPKIGKIANAALTSAPDWRDDVIEAGIRKFERASRLPEPNYEKIKEHRNWTVSAYNDRVEKIEESLQVLNTAQSGSLFTGDQDLSPLLEKASLGVRAAYVRDGYMRWEDADLGGNVSESSVRRRLRHELGVDALSSPSELSALARELSSAGVA